MPLELGVHLDPYEKVWSQLMYVCHNSICLLGILECNGEKTNWFVNRVSIEDVRQQSFNSAGVYLDP